MFYSKALYSMRHFYYWFIFFVAPNKNFHLPLWLYIGFKFDEVLFFYLIPFVLNGVIRMLLTDSKKKFYSVLI